ncbi:MAG: hypothetical protein ACFFDI_25625 [Promethearchaeota archaeon]
MTKETEFTLEELKPKYLDQPDRWNNWYFAVDFTQEGKDYSFKLAIAEGTLPLAKKILSFSKDPLSFTQEDDVKVLNRPTNDFNIMSSEEEELDFKETKDTLTIEMGDLTVICKPDERRLISKIDKLGADLIFTPRGPLFFWGDEKGVNCKVTETTRTAGIESLSNVKGTINFEGEEINVEGKGLFERVWINDLNFFEIRITNWIYANFDQLYMYLCHTESVTSDSIPFHFETGKVYLVSEDDYQFAKRIEVTPENWVYLKEARRFIPFEQTAVMRTDKGKLELRVIPIRYPQLIEAPMRLENFIVDNIPGWSTLFYDLPVKLEGKFVYKDGKTVELTDGRGMNELIRLVPL